MADQALYSTRLRREAQVRSGERTLTTAALRALHALGDVARRQLDASGMDPSVLDVRNPTWQAQITRHLLPAVSAVFLTAFQQEDRTQEPVTAAAVPVEPPPLDATYADAAVAQYLSQRRNMLTDVAETVFSQIIAALLEGRNAVTSYTDPATGITTQRAGESIPQLAARVDALLADADRWRNRAVTIARTETIGANEAGSQAAALNNAAVLGYGAGQVQKRWLATSDGRTRPSHAEADGQVVLGMSTPFAVGGVSMQRPGDPAAPADEVVNCRCTCLYAYPGDPDYRGDALAASASLSSQTTRPLHTVGANQEDTMADQPAQPDPADTDPAEAAEAQNGVVVVALPAADDPCVSIGEEQKHATLLYFGDVPVDGAGNPNPGLVDDFRTALTALVQQTAAATQPFTETVSGVESLGDDGARVWMLAGDALAPLRDALATGEVPDVLSQVTQYPSYTPHVTIGYPDTAPADAEDVTDDDAPDVDDAGDQEPPDTDKLDDATETAAAAITSIAFDRLAVWWAGDQTEFPLAAEATQGAGAQQTSARLRLGADGRTVYDQFGVHVGTYADPAPANDPAPTPPAAQPADQPATASDVADGQPFYGILWPEGVQSGDGRAIDAQATTWRDLPLSLMVQVETAMGHDGAVRSGRLDTIERDETTYAVPVIRYTGVWDTSDVAVEAARQVDNGVLKGLSVDGVSVTIELRDSQGRTLDPMYDPFPEDGVVVEVATEAQIGGATACSIPAFQQAYIANGTYESRTDPEPGWNEDGTPKDNLLPAAQAPAPEPEDEGQEVGGEDFDGPVTAVAASGWKGAPAWTLVASAGAEVREWAHADFDNPGLTEPTRLTVTDDGRVYGHLATWGVCHIGIDGVCQEAPVSETDYAYFATGRVQTDQGLVPVGQLTMGTGHAKLTLGHRAAAAHYDDTGTAIADVAIGQDGVGIWFAGRIRPGTTPEQVYALRASGSVSGDWRDIGTGLELVAALVVNTPGFPIPAPAIAASAAGATALVASGVVAPPAQPEPDTMDAASLVTQVIATLDRRARAQAASARLRQTRVAAAAARLNRKG